jgi:LPS sulfotransferase NodH
MVVGGQSYYKGMADPVPFVILSQPRTGSTLLCSLLNSHPQVRALVEPINPRTHCHHMRPVAGSACLLPEIMVQHNIQRALKILFAAEPPPQQWILSRKRGDRACGFKIMAHQLQGLKSEPQLWDYLVSNQIKTILCLRYNILMQYVSDLITIETRQPTCWDGKVKTARVKVRIDTLELELKRIMRQKQYLIDNVEQLGLPSRRIKYEDFKDDVTPVEDLLCWLIGEHYPVTTKLVKQNPDSLRARVINYDALAREVSRLGLDHLLVNTGSQE